MTRDVYWCIIVFYQPIENDNIHVANQIHGFTIDDGKFILISNRHNLLITYKWNLITYKRYTYTKISNLLGKDYEYIYKLNKNIKKQNLKKSQKEKAWTGHSDPCKVPTHRSIM